MSSPQQPPAHPDPQGQQRPFGDQQPGSPQHSNGPEQGHGGPQQPRNPQQPHSPQRAPARKSGWIIAVVVAAVLALVLGLLAVGAVTFLMRGGSDEPSANATTSASPSAPPAPVAPSPMTAVEAEGYSFSYPEHWQEQKPSTDGSTFNYYIETLDVVENSKMIVMEYPVRGTVAEECAAQAGDAGYGEQPDVEVDGVLSKHYQYIAPDEDGRPQVQDMWCLPRELTIVMVLGRTSGPEAEEAGVSEGQKVIDSWQWK